MMQSLKITGWIVAALILQMTLLPKYLLDPFQPNLLIILVVYFGLKMPHRFGGIAAFALGVLQDSFCGIYLGLHGFSYLLIYTMLSDMAGRLYTDNRLLFVLLVLMATVGSALLNLLMLAIFSVSKGLYSTLLPALVPQALVNALIASLVFNFRLPAAEEHR
jgi:rod shape-determining protein MreD